MLQSQNAQLFHYVSLTTTLIHKNIHFKVLLSIMIKDNYNNYIGRKLILDS